MYSDATASELAACFSRESNSLDTFTQQETEVYQMLSTSRGREMMQLMLSVSMHASCVPLSTRGLIALVIWFSVYCCCKRVAYVL